MVRHGVTPPPDFWAGLEAIIFMDYGGVDDFEKLGWG